MVFSNLQNHEKNAFFSLLDEYFASRPDVFGKAGTKDGPGSSNAAASAVHRALASNPEATSNFVAAGLRHAGSNAKSNNPYGAAASDPEVSNTAGRVAAASLAFSARNNSNSTSPPPIAQKPGSGALAAGKGFGGVDMSSKRAMVGSLYGGNKSPSPAPPPAASSFPAKSTSNTFAPPPSYRGVPPGAGDRAVSLPSRYPAHPEPEEEETQEEEEEETQGEWGEALYDYDSGETGDLAITEGGHVLVTERTSDDWWTGEFNGHKGLFPASYVKLL